MPILEFESDYNDIVIQISPYYTEKSLLALIWTYPDPYGNARVYDDTHEWCEFMIIDVHKLQPVS